jgi:hypothetical protein
MELTGKTEVLRKALFTTKILYGLAWDRKRGQRPVIDHFDYGPASMIVVGICSA